VSGTSQRSSVRDTGACAKPGIVDEEIERLDTLDSSLRRRHARRVQSQGRDASIRVGQRPARIDIHPTPDSPRSLLYQCPPDAAIATSNRYRSVCDSRLDRDPLSLKCSTVPVRRRLDVRSKSDPLRTRDSSEGRRYHCVRQDDVSTGSLTVRRNSRNPRR
jgi:hypothetical protein